MKQIKPKTLRTVKPQPAVKSRPSKLAPKVKLSKSDPDYYRKIGLISAKRRKLTSEDFSAMAKLSHNPDSRPDGYKGGRKPKDTDGTKMA